jgi:site-specific DNA-cytosine methylase
VTHTLKAAGGNGTGRGRGVPIIAATLTSHGVGTCGPDDNQAQARHLIPFVKAKRAQNDTDDETWEPGRPSPTLNALDTGESRATTVVTTPNAVRRLTPVETERLQGFPDDWTATCSDSQRYKQMGNAVAVPVVQWIGTRLADRIRAERAA